MRSPCRSCGGQDDTATHFPNIDTTNGTGPPGASRSSHPEPKKSPNGGNQLCGAFLMDLIKRAQFPKTRLSAELAEKMIQTLGLYFFKKTANRVAHISNRLFFVVVCFLGCSKVGTRSAPLRQCSEGADAPRASLPHRR